MKLFGKKGVLKQGKRKKISQLTNEELHTLVQLRESGQIEQLLVQIEIWKKKKQFDLDSDALLLSLEVASSFVKGAKQETLITRVNTMYEKQNDLTSIQSKLALNLSYTVVNYLLKGEMPKNAKNFDELHQLVLNNTNAVDFYFREWLICIIQENRGWVELQHGQYEESLKFTIESYTIAKKYNWKSLLVSSSNIIAIYYHEISEFDLAIKKYQEILDIYKNDMNSTSAYLVIAVNLCECYMDIGKYEEALKLAKDTSVQAKESKNYRTVTSCLSLIVDGMLELGLMEDIESYLIELEELTKIPEISFIAKYQYKSTMANKLRKSTKFADQIEAQILFTDVIDNTPGVVIEFQHYFALLDLILKEIKTTGNEERYVELKQRVLKLKDIGQRQRSYIWMIEIALLESKITVIDQDLQKAQILLDQALKLAREKKLHRLLYKVSMEYDHFLDEKQKRENEFREFTTIRERIENAQVDETIEHALRRNIVVKEIAEEPLYLLLLANTGVTVFAHTFNMNQPIDEILVGGFLSAINTFCQEMFASKGYLERVKYQNYTILLEPIGESLMCCYVIHGESFLASQRLKKFTESIEKGPLYAEFLKVQQTGDVAFNHHNVNDLIASHFIM